MTATLGASGVTIMRTEKVVGSHRKSQRKHTTTQELHRQSVELSKKFAAAAASVPSAVTRDLFASFRVCGQCSSFERFGEPHDGGYLMCMDSRANYKAAYSLGIANHDLWSEDVVNKLNIPVNMFDCTVAKAANVCKGCKFYKKCLVSADGKHPVPGHESDGWSLQQALSETGQGNASDGSLLMKMDIEGSEWPIWGSEPPDFLKKLGQLTVEFHGLSQVQKHQQFLQAMQHIQAGGLKVAHIHGNNNIGKDHRGDPRFIPMYKVGNLTIPNLVEVTFVRSEALPGGCLEDQQPNALDARNIPADPELPMAHLR